MNIFKRLFNVNGNKSLEFWMSHLIIMVSTVLGVYLAASAGFTKALEYEQVKSNKDSYYLQFAMKQELEDNLDSVQEWSEDFLAGNARKYMDKKRTQHYQLEDFIWTSMTQTPITFEVPNKVLTGLRRYYSSTKRNLQAMTSVSAPHKQVTTMLAETKQVRADLLPLIDESLATLKASLGDYGVVVD